MRDARPILVISLVLVFSAASLAGRPGPVAADDAPMYQSSVDSDPTSPDPRPNGGLDPAPEPDPDPGPEPDPDPEPDPAPDPDPEPEEPDDGLEVERGSPLIGAGEPTGEVDPLAAAIGVVGFLVLMGFAAWWMLRRKNPDAVPLPPPSDVSPPSDLI